MATTADGRFIRARVMRAFGVEYQAAEFLSGRAETAVSPIPLRWSDRQVQIVPVHMTPKRPVEV